MPRPIDGDAFAKDLEIAASSLRVSWVLDRHEMFAKRDAYREIADRVRKAPTLDCAPVRHGEWIEQEITPGDFYYTCSVCKVDWFIPDGTPAENFMHYCPRCGAKMDAKEDAE